MMILHHLVLPHLANPIAWANLHQFAAHPVTAADVHLAGRKNGRGDNGRFARPTGFPQHLAAG